MLAWARWRASVATSLLALFQTTKPRYREEWKDVGQGAVVDHDHMSFRYMDLLGAINPVLTAICHFYRERSAFMLCSFNHFAGHIFSVELIARYGSWWHL